MRIGVCSAAIAICVALVSPSHGQSIHGLGNTPCTHFLRAARSSDMLYHQAASWLLGYASGMNAALRSSPTAALGNDQLLKSAGDYCEANPAGTIAQAASQWYAGLPKEPEPRQAEQSRGWTIEMNKPSGYRGPRP